MASTKNTGTKCSNCGAANQTGTPYCRHCKVPGTCGGKQKAAKKSSAKTKKKTARR